MTSVGAEPAVGHQRAPVPRAQVSAGAGVGITDTPVVNVTISVTEQARTGDEGGDVDGLMVIFVVCILLINTNIFQCLHSCMRFWRRKCCKKNSENRFV